MSAIPTTTPQHPTLQYLRECRLIVSDASGQALDLSKFRIKFAVKRSNAQTPNTASIKVYNVAPNTALAIQQQFTRVVLQAGYQGNYGVIFAGNTKQTIIGRESATDTFVEIIAGDGDVAYNFAIVNASVGANSCAQDQVNACINSKNGTASLGTTAGGNSTLPTTTRLPRGKALYGQAKQYLRDIADSTGYDWSIQNEKVVFVPKNGYLPGTAISINAQNGMVGSPQQTLQGVNVKCLINPSLQMGGRVQLDNSSIQRLAIDLSVPGTAAAIPAPLTTDGVYFILLMQHNGDTRGIEWYTSLVTVYIDPSLPINSAVGVGR